LPMLMKIKNQIKSRKDKSWQTRMFAAHKPGTAHRMFKVPKGTPLPLTFLQKIVDTPLGKIAHNPTQIGIRSIRVTPRVKAEANGMLNAIRVSQGKYRGTK
jgi:hypothetical protein